MTNHDLTNTDASETALEKQNNTVEILSPSELEKKVIAPLSLSVVDQPTTFLLLRTEWNELVSEANVHIFQTFDWQWFWWKHYGNGLDLHILTFRENEKLVGIVPLFQQPVKLFGIPIRRILRMMGCGIGAKENFGLPAEYGPSDYLNAIVRPGYERVVAESFSEYLLQRHTACRELRLENVSHESVLYKYFLPAFEAKHLTATTTRIEFAPYIATPGSLEEYTAQLTPGMRHHIRQTQKQFKNNPPFSITAPTSQAMVRNAFSDLVHLHQLRWNTLGYAGLFSDVRFLNFQTDIVMKFHEQGTLWFKTVRMGGINTAARMGFIFKGRMYDYLSGFDETFPEGKKRPSLALLVDMIEDAVVHKCSIIDLLRGTEQYKMKMTSSVSQNSDIRVTGFTNNPPLLYVLYLLVWKVQKILRRLADEKALFAVQFKIRGFPKCLITYPKFVKMRIQQKLSKYNGN